MHADTNVRWAAPASAVLFWESWGEQHAVFDLRSGETHMLPDTTVRVLQQLARCPSTVREVADHLCVASDKVCDEQFLEQVVWLFLQLQNAGLIEKADR
jgi:PqqD family protein of HPr-rel-A system